MGFDIFWADMDGVRKPPEAAYFQATSFGMDGLLNEMAAQGMGYLSDPRVFPDPRDFAIPRKENGRLDEESQEFEAYVAAERAAADSENRERPGIPLQKIAWNSDLVTPWEIETALERALPEPQTLEPERHAFWQKWLEYMAAAKEHGGFRIS